MVRRVVFIAGIVVGFAVGDGDGSICIFSHVRAKWSGNIDAVIHVPERLTTKHDAVFYPKLTLSGGIEPREVIRDSSHVNTAPSETGSRYVVNLYIAEPTGTGNVVHHTNTPALIGIVSAPTNVDIRYLDGRQVAYVDSISGSCFDTGTIADTSLRVVAMRKLL